MLSIDMPHWLSRVLTRYLAPLNSRRPLQPTTRSRHPSPSPRGSVHLIGAGPGAVDLLTVRAWQLIRQAEVVIYDRLVGDDVLDLIPAGAERYYVGKAELW